MKILAFDTTNQTLSVAVLFDGKVKSQRNIFEENKHSELLVTLIEECLNESEIWYSDLDLISFTNGPGSFTGIRVGFSCAKALAITTKLPVIAIDSLEAAAFDYLEKSQIKKILVVNDARLEELFIEEFNVENKQLQSVFEPKLIKADEIEVYLPKEKFILAGSAKKIIEAGENAVIFEQNDFINAANVALLAQQKYSPNQQFATSALYIRKPKISKRKGQK